MAHQSDCTREENISLEDIYHQLTELDSIHYSLRHQMGSIALQSILARPAVSSMATEGRSPGLDDWPDGFFKKIHSELEQASRKVMNLHDSMRKIANASSKYRIRSLNILDLPDELLREIFEYCRGENHSGQDYVFVSNFFYRDGIRDIKNIRITCRRFSNTSSHLLLRHVDVTMTPSSIAHMEEVARHPLISRGIQVIRVHLNYFGINLATDITQFAMLAVRYTEEALVSRRAWLEDEEDKHPYGIPREALVLAIEKAELMCEEWADLLQRIEDPVADLDIIEEAVARSRNIAGLARAHETYRLKYLAQESVLKNGTFTHAVATVMSKVPTAKRLFVGDSFRDLKNEAFNTPFVDAAEDPERLAARWTVRPRGWDEARIDEQDDQPKEVLLHLLTAVFDNWNPIDYLCVNLSPATDLSIPATREQLRQLAAGAECLRVFDFYGDASETHEEPAIDRNPEQIASFGSFLSVCMGGKALRRLSVHLGFALDEFSPQPPVCMGSLLTSRQSPELKDVHLSDYPLDLSKLEIFLEHLNGPLCISLAGILLLSGTWAEALDLIRDKADWRSSVARSRGAECDELSEEEMVAIFGKDCPRLGEVATATLYIRGIITDNPLRTRETVAPIAVS